MPEIRKANYTDQEGIRQVHSDAFPEVERAAVATLAAELLGEATSPETISLVAEVDGVVVGHIAFSPVTTDTKSWKGYILAPLGVKPGYQKQGVGAALIGRGIQMLSERGVHLLFVYGDPAYYGRFGFSDDHAAGFLPPYELEYPFGWQAKILNESVAVKPEQTNQIISCVASLSHADLW